MTVAVDFADLADLADLAEFTELTQFTGFAPTRRPLAPVPDRMPVPRPTGSRRPFDATIVPLYPPSQAAVAAPLRLTRRGVVVIAGLVAALAVALVGLAWASAPAAHRLPTRPTAVTVQAGDTLWSIAGRVAPNRDPRAEVADLQRINRLASVALVPGQVLTTAG
jgi:LysM domain-containing protein